MEKWIDESLDAFVGKYRRTLEHVRGMICYTTGPDGRFDDRSGDDQIGWWTNGFWTGLLWQLWAASGDESFREEAIALEERFDRIFLDASALDHDNGFRWLPNAVVHYRQDGDKAALNRGILAAGQLAGRFNPTGGFIRAWNPWPGMTMEGFPDDKHIGWAIIDCMMNLPLLYWASEVTGDPRFKDIAMRHADKALASFIRPDGSAVHICVFDPSTGDLVKTLGGQGYAEGSSWTRGQGWALYGFTLSYLHTKEERYLEAARKVASYVLSQIPGSGLIPIDFRQPAEPAWEDSSASTIIACGLIELSKLVSGKESDDYMAAALKLLRTLHEERNDYTDAQDIIVTRSSEAYHRPVHETAIIYADYYYLEALLKLKGKALWVW